MPDTIMTEQPTDQPIMGMRRRSPQWGDLMTALAKAQGEIEGAKKDSQNPHFKSSYADLASVMTAIREPLAKNGVAVTQWPRVVDGAVEIETILAHGEQFISDVLWMPCAKMDAHGIGSAITYGRRYALMAAAGVAPEDDDGNGAVEGHKPGLPGSAGGGGQFRQPGRRNVVPSNFVEAARQDGTLDTTRPKGVLPATAAAAKDKDAIKMAERVKKAIAFFAEVQTKEDAQEYWHEREEPIGEIESAMPTEYERLLKAYNAALERVSERAA